MNSEQLQHLTALFADSTLGECARCGWIDDVGAFAVCCHNPDLLLCLKNGCECQVCSKNSGKPDFTISAKLLTRAEIKPGQLWSDYYKSCVLMTIETPSGLLSTQIFIPVEDVLHEHWKAFAEGTRAAVDVHYDHAEYTPSFALKHKRGIVTIISDFGHEISCLRQCLKIPFDQIKPALIMCNKLAEEEKILKECYKLEVETRMGTQLIFKGVANGTRFRYTVASIVTYPPDLWLQLSKGIDKLSHCYSRPKGHKRIRLRDAWLEFDLSGDSCYEADTFNLVDENDEELPPQPDLVVQIPLSIAAGPLRAAFGIHTS